jgi:hypothetical protein
MSRAVVFSLMAMLALSACSAGSDGPSYGAVGPSGDAAEARNDQATRAACRDRTNEMFDRRDRAQIYTPGSSVNTPFSANYQPGITSRGLPNQFDYERTVAECVRNSGTGAETPAIQPPAPPPRSR